MVEAAGDFLMDQFSVLGAVQDFAAASLQADDMSLAVVRRRAPQRNA
jgi:hypothetical protein